eukprot:1365753-Pyramimonas_sp.AAC.1
MVQESLRGHVTSSKLPMILPSQEIRNMTLLLSVQTARYRWGPEPYSCRLVFHHHIGRTQSDISVYATTQGSQRRDSQVGSDALD